MSQISMIGKKYSDYDVSTDAIEMIKLMVLLCVYQGNFIVQDIISSFPFNNSKKISAVMISIGEFALRLMFLATSRCNIPVSVATTKQ